MNEWILPRLDLRAGLIWLFQPPPILVAISGELVEGLAPSQP